MSNSDSLVAELARFDTLVRVLRAECPWDREQTHVSLRRHLLEETYETLEVLDEMAVVASEVDPSTTGSMDAGAVSGDLEAASADLDERLCEELGDLLYQVWFQSLLAAERDAFTLGDVARSVHDKLVGRHPHVFGDVEAANADEVRSRWDVIKQAEKGRQSTMDGISATLPALLRSVKVLKRAGAAGLTSDSATGAVCEQAAVDLARLATEPSEELLGEVLVSVVDVARRLSLDPEDALRGATERAEAGFRRKELEQREQHQQRKQGEDRQEQAL